MDSHLSTLKMIDEKVQRIITEQYERAQTLSMIHQSALEIVTQKLLKTETMDGTVVKEALVDTEKD
jgi:ATP-dependent Zn protease